MPEKLINKGFFKVLYMFLGDTFSTSKAKTISNYFSNHNNFLTHAKPLTLDMIKSNSKTKDLKIKNIEEENPDLAIAVWEYYCRFEGIMNPMSPINKIFHSENEYIVNLAPFIQVQNPVQVPQQPGELPTGGKKK